MSQEEVLAASTDMTPVQGSVDVAVPLAIMWESFTHANRWPRWNTCFFWVWNRSLIAGKHLIWCFEPIRWWYLYKMPALAKIVEVEERHKVTWEVTALPGFYARHTYFMEDLGNGHTRFGSYEKAMGWSFRLLKWFWIAHFVFVKDRSLAGARVLEEEYRKTGTLTADTLPPRRSWRSFLPLVLLLAVVVGGGGFAGWVYVSYLRLTSRELAAGIYAVLNGGCNSLVVKDGGEVLLVDPKFPPGSRWLHKWIAQNIGAPVTQIVNTHYHFDHTQGNIHYPEAQLFAHKSAPALMRHRDGQWWSRHQESIPPAANLIDETRTLRVGTQEILVTHPGRAHTESDLWVHLRKGDVEVVATGDLVFCGYYPFFDLGEGGADLPGLVKTIRALASTYPHAVFVPGHGPLAAASDLARYADYLQFLSEAVARAREHGLTEDGAVRDITLSRWNLSLLPIFHYGQWWATAESNIRSVYRLQTR